MRHTVCLLAGVLLGVWGCNKAMKVDNPVVGPPPPRVNVANAAGVASVDGQAVASADVDGVGDVIQTSASQNFTDRSFSDGTVVATVNGVPIFAGEILDPYRPNLLQAKKQMTPEQYRAAREALVRQDLPRAIERKLLAHSLRSGLKAEQIKALDAQLDEMFKEELTNMMKKMGVTSVRELEIEFQNRGLSLDQIKKTFADQQMAQQYMFIHARSKINPTREQLLEYYREHAADYETPAKVRWQQILISHEKHGGRSGAQRRLSEAANELLEGKSFDEVAKKYSDGPTASSGGKWDWTQKGSLADKEVEKLLFTLPVGEVSPVIRAKDQFQVVMVVERQEAGRIRFEDVQGDIKKALQAQDQQARIEETLAELKADAVIHTIFDEPNSTALR